MGLFGFGKKKEDALAYLLHESLHGSFEVEDVVEDDHIYLPQWQITITPVIQQLTEQSAVLDFILHSPGWDQRLYECCACAGNDTKQAMGMAVGSFLFGFMQGISKLQAKELPRPFETTFAGKPHRFNAYLSDIVGLGESPQVEDCNVYWELLKDDIKKRMGNQRFCYVKVYGSKVNGQNISECRINDIISDELSEKMAKVVEKWDAENFASHKQFFFIEQEPATITPYPYWGEAGQKDFIGKVIKAVSLFHASTTQEAFDSLHERMITELGDATLATECRYFLPEICAENAAADKIKMGETIDLMLPGNRKITLYKHQLTDYYTLERTIFTAFGQGVFGEETNDIYQELVGTSAICSVLEQMLNNGSKLEDCHLTGLLFEVDDRFELR